MSKRPVIDYQLVNVIDVNDILPEWQPLGGPVVTTEYWGGDPYTVIKQVMVRREPHPKLSYLLPPRLREESSDE